MTKGNWETQSNALDAINGLSQEAIEALPAAIYTTDAEGRLTIYNEAAAELWGRHPELGESKFCGSWKLYLPDGTPLPHDECPMAMALQQRQPIRGVEAVAERPDGTRIPFISYPTPLFDGSGRLTGAVNMLVDISARKEAEEKLRKSERESWELLGALPAAIFVTGAEGHITYCNQSAVDLWGARPTLGKDKWYDLWRLYHTDGSPMALTDCPTEIALNHGQSARGREGIIERKDGTRIPVISYPTPLRDETGAIVGVVNMTVDISGRKEAELALAERTMQLALAAKAARVGSFAYDIDTERMQISAGYAAIHGFPDGTTEIARSEWQLGVHPEDRVRWEALRSCAYRKRWEEYSGEYRIVRSGGEIRWIEARIFVSYDGDGRPRRAVGVDIDATERKRTEALLSESKALLADAMAAGHVMAFDWDAVTGLTQRSDNADDVLGSDQDQSGGPPRNTFLSHMHPDDRTSLKKCIRTLRPGTPSYALTFRFVRPDGRLVWLEETARGEFDATGKLLRVRGLTRDISDRKRAEDALAERNAQLALAGKVALVGSYAYDVNADSMRVSKGYAAIHGLPEGTTETTRSEWRSRVHPEDIGRLQGLRRRAFRDRVGEYNIEYRIVSPDRGLRWIESRSFISYDADGCPQRVIGVNIDVTERKRAEERQRVLVAELDHRVKNALATVSSVISQTGVGSRSVANFVASLDGRIRSMATTHELLSSGRWNGISLTELVRGELAPYATRNNTEICGPEVVLKPEAGQAMAMVLHELATNAAKYGALSTNEGRVSIRWDRWPNGHPPRLVLEWQEIDGPPVVAPGKISFGTSTIRDLIPYEFGGTVDLAFAPAGVQCRLELSADWLINNGEPLVETEPGADATQARCAKAPARRPGVFP